MCGFANVNVINKTGSRFLRVRVRPLKSLTFKCAIFATAAAAARGRQDTLLATFDVLLREQQQTGSA